MMCGTTRTKGGPFRFVGKIILGLLAAAVFALAIGAIAMVLWNWVMVDVLELPAITYWQAFGVVLLAKLLFGFGGPGGHEKKEKKHPEGPIRREIRREMEKEFSREAAKKKNGYASTKSFDSVYEDWWKKEGADSFDEYMKQRDAQPEDEGDKS